MRTHREFPTGAVLKAIPPLKAGDVRIITLGGVEEIGKNMTAVEYGGDIIVIDMGLEFPGEETPGIDYIIPDTTYLEQNKNRIRGIFITHGHLDHIGGIPYLMPRLGNPPLYTRNLTSIMIKKRQEEFPYQPPLNIITVEKETTVKVGKLNVRFFGVTHSIPDSMGIIIETPFGWIVTTGDFKLEHEDSTPTPAEEETYKIFDKGKVLLLMASSTNIENPGFSIPEKEVHKSLESLIRTTTGRLIIGTFASQFQRMMAVIQSAEKNGRKVVVEGRSMRVNLEAAQLAGIFKPKKATIVLASEIDNYPDNQILILATGAQGEEYSALMRMSGRSKNLKALQIKKGDTVVLSSSIIPGNERTVQKLKDNISRRGAKIIHYRTSEIYIHSSGHGNCGELEWLQKKVRPRFFIPIHGHHYMLRLHADLAMSLGLPEKNIVVPDNGMVTEITGEGKKIAALKETVPNRTVMVDGLSTDNVKEVVIRDRQMLAQEGIFVIIAIIDKDGRVRKSPDIISRGFVYLKESQDLLRHVRLLIKKRIEGAASQMHPINLDYVKNILREEVGKYLFLKTHNRPIILPVLIEV